jgi:hypothetical protein
MFCFPISLEMLDFWHVSHGVSQFRPSERSNRYLRWVLYTKPAYLTCTHTDLWMCLSVFLVWVWFFWQRVSLCTLCWPQSLCSPGWPPSYDPPTSQVLRLYSYAAMSGVRYAYMSVCVYINNMCITFYIAKFSMLILFSTYVYFFSL